jgi:phosphoglycolate phosphatase
MKLLLFDLDGTLLTTGRAGVRALNRAFEKARGLKDAMDGMSLAGKTDPLIVREVVEKKLGRPAGDAEIRDVCDLYLEYLPEEVRASAGYRVMEGARELLDSMKRRDDVLLALGTGNLEKGARIKLERGGLNPYFSFGGFGSDAEDRSEVLRTAVRRGEERAGTRLPPRDVFVIGDTLLDVAAGKAIGAVTVAVTFGHGAAAGLRAAAPDLLLDSFARPEAFLAAL